MPRWKKIRLCLERMQPGEAALLFAGARKASGRSARRLPVALVKGDERGK